MNSILAIVAIIAVGSLSLLGLNHIVLQSDVSWSYGNNSSSEVWPQLFLPMAPTSECLDEFNRILFPSLRLFWPKRNRDLLVMTDAESPQTSRFIPQLKSEIETHVNQLQVVTNTALFPQTGHNRQQWLMFWADNFTDAEFVAFIDTDTTFTGRILHADLFESGKPRVLGVYGEPTGDWWSGVPYSTFIATGYLEKFKAMTYFPVVIRLSHLHLIREHVRQHMGEPTFDHAFRKIIARSEWSQFNIMLNVLYELRHEDYYWHINERNPSWKGPVPFGQVPSKQESGIRPVEFNRPRPKQAIHWTWEKFGKIPEPENTAKYYEVLKFGYCYSLNDIDRHLERSVCQQIQVVNQLNPYEWIFEGDDYSDRPGVLEAHHERRMLIQQAGAFDWDQDLVRLLENKTASSKQQPIT